MRFRSFLAIILLSALLCGGCEKKMPEAVGLGLPGLVVAEGAPKFEPQQGRWFEAVMRDGAWEYFDSASGAVSVKDEDDLHRALRIYKNRSEVEGYVPHGLISAAGDARFEDIAWMLRQFATVGYSEIHLLVRNVGDERANRALRFKFPWHLTDLDLMTIHVGGDDQIDVGTGADRRMLDDGAAGRRLPGLNQLLENVAAAARASKSPAICRVFISMDASYQRVIDVFSKLHEHEVDYLCHEWISED